jgi:hypothetical protein
VPVCTGSTHLARPNETQNLRLAVARQIPFELANNRVPVRSAIIKTR